MTDITAIIFQYRECCRHLWNSYFLKLQWNEGFWDMQDYFNEVSQRLFQTTVLRQCFGGNEIKPTETNYYKEIKVEPNFGPIGFQAMWADTGRGYSEWKTIQITSTGNDFRFIEFFDWTVEQTMECQFSKVKLTASNEYPELVNNDFLLDTWNVRFIKSE
ncbi:MAG TPA: hypothetical protein VEY10_08460 [Flavisolibacter sp.]|nr:hypothetical protein [Flavisolibacter sp.]